MNGKERVMKTLSFEETDRTPWVPYAGVQTANLIGLNAEEYLKSADNIVAGITKAYEEYQPDGLPIVFDLQMEAEVLGCELRWAANNPPSVASHILDTKKLSELKLPAAEDGRYPIAMEAAKRLVNTLGDKIALYALICGPFTLALHLRGTEIFTDMMEEPEDAEAILEFCTEVEKDLARMYIEQGVEIIAAVDPMTSQISPRHFKKFVKPYVTELNQYIHSLGAKATMFCCGDATKNIELMCQLDADGIAFDENVDLAFARDIAVKYKVSYGGNLPLTTKMLFGTPLDNVEEARHEVEIGKGLGFMLSPGCDMPFDTPINNIKAISAFMNGNTASLEVLTGQALDDDDSNDEDFEDVKIEKGQAFIEIVTLDSEGCAPCQYMCETVKNILPRYGDRLLWRESLVKTKAGIRRMGKLGVKNLPAMLINGELVFDNIIPTEKELTDAIEARM